MGLLAFCIGECIINLLEILNNLEIYLKLSVVSSQNSTFCQDENFKSLRVFSYTQILMLGDTGDNMRGSEDHRRKKTTSTFYEHQ